MVATHLLFCPPCPCPAYAPAFEIPLFLLLGFFSRAFFFFCSFSFFCSSRVCSLPSRGWAGVGSWLLLLAAAFVFSFLFWLGGVVWFCLSWSCFCLCLGCLAVGWFCGVCASWVVFCRRVCLVCLRACCALSCSWGFVPLFFCAR